MGIDKGEYSWKGILDIIEDEGRMIK